MESSLFIIFSFIAVFTGCASYFDSLKSYFQLTGKHTSKFKKVNLHDSVYRADSLKRKATILLIGNMDARMTYVNKSWDNFQVEPYTLFRKENRPSELIKEFNALYDKYAFELLNLTYISNLQTASVQFLISNINQAFQAWKSPYSKHLNIVGSCESTCPYRIGTEHLSNWRAEMNNSFPICMSAFKNEKTVFQSGISVMR